LNPGKDALEAENAAGRAGRMSENERDRRVRMKPKTGNERRSQMIDKSSCTPRGGITLGDSNRGGTGKNGWRPRNDQCRGEFRRHRLPQKEKKKTVAHKRRYTIRTLVEKSRPKGDYRESNKKEFGGPRRGCQGYDRRENNPKRTVSTG